MEYILKLEITNQDIRISWSKSNFLLLLNKLELEFDIDMQRVYKNT